MESMKSHTCREGDNIGLMWVSNYPRVTTYCKVCRKEMRRVALDDVPSALADLAFDMIKVIQEKKGG